MKEKKKEPGKVLWRILFILLLLIFFAVLELNKNTVAGWIAAAVLFAVFYILRSGKLSSAAFGIRFLSWLGLLILCAAVIKVSWPPVKAVPAVSYKNPEKTQVIRLAQGDLRGVMSEDGKVEVYTGIPYAKAPVGELRWKEPQPADKWEGILEADHFAPMSMQTTNLPIYDTLVRIIGYHDFKISLNDNYRPPVSEDSLYINIWRPAEGKRENLPVLVYIHGGSLQTGQPWYHDYNGEGLAKEGLIVVNMGYRLGVFGFFADEALAAESEHGSTGNYGLLDQIAALEWVRDNIEAFGGDPGNVTLAGESAGSACVSALCTSPLAKGLFRRAILESSTVSAPIPAHSYRKLESGYAAAKQTMERFGVSDVNGLRRISAEDIVGELNYHHHMTVDGYVLEEDPYESYKKGIHNEEAQLHGFNLDEAAAFTIFNPGSMKNYEDRLKRVFGEERLSKVLALYPASNDKEAKEQWNVIDSVLLFTYGHYCLGRQAQANGIPSYIYHFTKDNKSLGPWHSGEEIYLYANIPEKTGLYDDADRELSRIFSSYVVNFAKTGDPNGPGLPVWELSGGGKKVLELGEKVEMTGMPYMDLYDIFDEIQKY